MGKQHLQSILRSLLFPKFLPPSPSPRMLSSTSHPRYFFKLEPSLTLQESLCTLSAIKSVDSHLLSTTSIAHSPSTQTECQYVAPRIKPVPGHVTR